MISCSSIGRKNEGRVARTKVFRLRQDQRGTALIETALALPFLLVLGLGIFEFGNLLYNYHLISSGVRDAARYLARFDHAVAVTASKEAEAERLAVTGSILVGGTPRVSWWSTSDVSVSYVPAGGISNPIDPITEQRPYRGGDTVWIVRVSTDVPYGGLGFLEYLGLGSTINFNFSHEERQIGE
jgi:TadE-like protein